MHLYEPVSWFTLNLFGGSIMGNNDIVNVNVHSAYSEKQKARLIWGIGGLLAGGYFLGKYLLAKGGMRNSEFIYKHFPEEAESIDKKLIDMLRKKD